MRVAFVHDWLTGTRGGERVLEQLALMFPDADLFTLFRVPGTAPHAVERLNIRTSPLDAVPGVHRFYRSLLPLLPAAVEALDLSGYDLVISSSHCVAKGVRARGAVHVCYCHTPMRYAWDQRAAYFTGATGRLRALLAAPFLARLRRWDVATAACVHRFIANSRHVRGRIRRVYRRDADVVHPPVAVSRFSPAPQRDDAYVCAGALVPYKRIDIAIAAFNRSGRRLLIVGDGPEYRRLRRAAHRNVTFAGHVDDAAFADLLARARALVMPMVEDFGIVAVEAQAAGTPVIALRAGGVLDTVTDGETGILFDGQSPAALEAAVARSERVEFDAATLRRSAERFSPAAFCAGIRTVVARATGGAVDAAGRSIGAGAEPAAIAAAGGGEVA